MHGLRSVSDGALVWEDANDLGPGVVVVHYPTTRGTVRQDQRGMDASYPPSVGFSKGS